MAGGHDRPHTPHDVIVGPRAQSCASRAAHGSHSCQHASVAALLLPPPLPPHAHLDASGSSSSGFSQIPRLILILDANVPANLGARSIPRAAMHLGPVPRPL